MITLYTGNDNLVELLGLSDLETGLFINNAVVIATLFDNAGNIITTISLPYVAASDGEYEGVLPSTTPLDVGAPFQLDILATGASTALWQLPVRVRSRIS